MKGCHIVLLLCASCCSLVTGCDRSSRRRGPPPDNTKPTITCPANIHAIADPFQINTKVSWVESLIIANDDRDGPITPTRTGKAPGTIFSEGVTTIKYHAKDKSGNFASCSFDITVEVLRCKPWDDIEDGWKICHVSHDMRLGSICRFGCYGGHELVGESKTECLESEHWDIASQPYCQKLQCDKLYPTSGQNGIVDIVCADENNYRSKCSYNCAEGYSVLPGHSKVQVCNEFGRWRGTKPVCVDAEPPVYTSCPYVKVGYAERSKTTGRVWWNDPIAMDNSGSVTSTQISAPVSGTELEVGEHTVQYMAYDDANNTAICEFKVFVKQIKCHTIYPLPYTSVTCPDGRIFGSKCQFICDDGTSLNGQTLAECDKTDHIVPNGAWTFRDRQPYCENLNTCPALRAPDNGALACDTWLNGKFCQMLCQEGYVVMDDPQTVSDEVRVHKSLLVCGDSGTWYISSDIPNCQEVSERLALYFTIDIDYLYYDGPCNETRDDIKANFIEAFTQVTGMTCSPPDCSVSSVQLICGESTAGAKRKRRDLSSGIAFQVSLQLSGNQTATETVKTRSAIRDSINIANNNGGLDIVTDGTTSSPSGIEVSQPIVTCEQGSAYNKKTFQCVKCNPGYYHDTSRNVCSPCARGYYQDQPQQNTCIQCPPGTTTKTKGAHSVSICEDACPAGFYSATGTTPCSACDLGWFSENYGSIECTRCQGSQITLVSGATSGSQCKEFDLSYSQLNDTEESSVATMNLEVDDLNQFTLSFFVKCENCTNIVTLAGTEGTILSIIHTDQLLVDYNGYQYETGEKIAQSILWTRLTIVRTETEFRTYLNDIEIISKQIPNRKRRSTHTSLNATVTVGGEGFIGSVSQMNMWSGTNVLNLSISTNTCFTSTKQGDLMNWAQFSELDGSFVITNSICDVDDNCQSKPCQNGGSCKDAVDNFSCTCLRGYTGNACEVNIDDCLDNACDNEATCIDGEDSYTCLCTEGFTGELCETHFVDGGWTDWESSGECSVTCESGWQQYSRVCENPIPINGGKECVGDAMTTVACETNVTCVNECVNEPSRLENGSMNCEWTDNETRVCKPTCDEGFDFDSDMFVNTGVICGPDTGFTWNINNTDNPLLLIPACTLKVNAVSNKLNVTASYPTLSGLDPDITSEIKSKVNSKIEQTGCVATNRCKLHDTHVFTSDQSTERKRREITTYTMFTIELSCDVTDDMNECYDLLAEVVEAINSYIDTLEFTIQSGGNDYDVGINSTSLDGVSVCQTGHVPVLQYCVACGKGTYLTNDYCERCSRGYFQDEEAQSSCKPCPVGCTTAGLMTRDREYCNIETHVEDDIIHKWLILGLSSGLVLIIIIVVATATICCKSKQSQKNKTHSSTADFSDTFANRDHLANANNRFGNRSRSQQDKSIELSEYPNESVHEGCNNPTFTKAMNFWRENKTTIKPSTYSPRCESPLPVRTDAYELPTKAVNSNKSCKKLC